MPGFIDAHTHIWSADALTQMLLCAVTTALDMFSHPRTVNGLRHTPSAAQGPLVADVRVDEEDGASLTSPTMVEAGSEDAGRVPR